MPVPERYKDPSFRRMKADQCWEMAGLARQDGDTADEKRYTEEARKWQRPYEETKE